MRWKRLNAIQAKEKMLQTPLVFKFLKRFVDLKGDSVFFVNGSLFVKVQVEQNCNEV